MESLLKQVTFIIFFFLLASCAWAASSHAPVNIMAVDPPRGPRAPGWSQWVSNIEPHVQGIVVFCQWDKVETSQGTYDFTPCDDVFTNFPTNLKFAIVLEPVSFHSNTATPAYIYSAQWAKSLGTSQLDYATCPIHPGDGNTPLNTYAHNGDTSALPAVWEKPFQVGWHNFLAKAIAHFNSVSYRNQIAYLRVGYAEGGQVSDPCEAVFVQMTGSITNLQADWVGGDQAMSNFIASQDPQVPYQMAISCSQQGWDCIDWADVEAATDIANRIGIGCEGAQYNDIKSEQNGVPSACDWVAMFSKYSAAPVVRQLQTWTQSSVQGKLPVGSLVNLLPFEAGNYASYVELYYQDLSCAYIQGYHDNTGCPSGYAAYVPYQQAIAGAEK